MRFDKISAIFEKVEHDRHISSYDIAEELDVDHKTVLRHLRKSRYKKTLDIWVLHDLTERNPMQCDSNCDSLLKRNHSLKISTLMGFYHKIIKTARQVIDQNGTYIL